MRRRCRSTCFERKIEKEGKKARKVKISPCLSKIRLTWMIKLAATTPTNSVRQGSKGSAPRQHKYNSGYGDMTSLIDIKETCSK